MRVTGYEWLVKSYSACVTGPFAQRMEREFWRAHQQARLCVEFAKNHARPARRACLTNQSFVKIRVFRGSFLNHEMG
jgi:hypothetical protein